MQWHLESGESGPLRAGLKDIDRLTGFNLDRPDERLAALGEDQDVWKLDEVFNRHRLVLLATRVDDDFGLALVTGLQQADDPVVLKLFANRAGENRAH